MAMARIVLGNREGSVAIRQGRAVLEQLTEEWPDLHLTLRTVANAGHHHAGALLDALTRGEVDVAVVQLDTLPTTLPEGVTLAAVLRRGEARSALVARGARTLAALPEGARVAVVSERDAAFLRAVHGRVNDEVSSDPADAVLARLGAGEIDAVLLPAATLTVLDLRNRIDAVLDTETFTPAPGQGAVGLAVRADDDLAFETAYSLQHRPSYDRVRAERAFAAALVDNPVGALASVTDDGELTLFGAVVFDGSTLQATVTGEAREAEELGRELANDVREQLAAI